MAPPTINMAAPTINPEDFRVRALLTRLFGGKEQWGLVRDLTVAPVMPCHRNEVAADPFILSRERFGGTEDVPLLPLMRRVTDKSLLAFSHFFPVVKEQVGISPISPHGSMFNSIRQWGAIDWDFVRDLDWRIYLPRQLGHESGFLSYFQNALDEELRRFDLHPILRGKDPEGRPQVQLRDRKTGEVHGFHLFLLTMDPGFVRFPLHEGGGYTVHQAYFSEDSIDPYLEETGVLWEGLLGRQRQQYEEMFQKVSFNTFAGNDPASQRLKTKGWYSRKAFKWYAALAHVRGLYALEEELLAFYREFQGDHGDLVHLIRHHFFALLDPAGMDPRRLEREISFSLSIAYARARSPRADPLVGKEAPEAGARVLNLEPAPSRWLEDALLSLHQYHLEGATLREEELQKLAQFAFAGRIRQADGIGEPGFHRLADGEEALLLPSIWSFVFSESYARRSAAELSKRGEPVNASETREALVALLAIFLSRALRGGCPDPGS